LILNYLVRSPQFHREKREKYFRGQLRFWNPGIVHSFVAGLIDGAYGFSFLRTVDGGVLMPVSLVAAQFHCAPMTANYLQDLLHATLLRQAFINEVKTAGWPIMNKPFRHTLPSLQIQRWGTPTSSGSQSCANRHHYDPLIAILQG
jgi:hypothetical protein